jgi:hypothetical protein
LPQYLATFYRREVALISYSGRSIENARRARDELFGVQNSRKAMTGILAGLLDPHLFGKLEGGENKLRESIQQRAEANPDFKSALEAYGKIKAAQLAMEKNAPLYDYYEEERPRVTTYRQPRGFGGTLFKYARYLVRLAEERTKPNGERLPIYQDAALGSLELSLLSSEPVYDDFETLLLADSLTDLASRFGATDSMVEKVLAGKSPGARATELVSSTKLKDLGFRKKMWNAD